MVTVREAASADFGFVRRLEESLYNSHAEARPDIFDAGAGLFTESEFAEWLSDPSRLILIAESGGTPAAYLAGYRAEPPSEPVIRDIPTFYIDELVTDPGFLRTGAASALVAAAEEYAKKRGYERITLNLWSFNSSASAFYADRGFLPLNTLLEKKIGEENT